MIPFTFGADYYPEHWPRERWETDAKMMRDLGLDVVRMGEFSWFKMEPEEGRFDFTWLDEAIALSERIGAEHTWLTHLSHTFPRHAEFAAMLSERTGGRVQPAYDGLTIE